MASEETFNDSRFGAATSSKAANSLPRPPGPVDTVRNALESAERLAARIEGLSRRLVGSIPECDTVASTPSGDGLFYEMGAHAEQVMAAISDAESAISRIERVLP